MMMGTVVVGTVGSLIWPLSGLTISGSPPGSGLYADASSTTTDGFLVGIRLSSAR